MSFNHVKKIVLRFRESALKKLFLYGNQFDPANNYLHMQNSRKIETVCEILQHTIKELIWCRIIKSNQSNIYFFTDHQTMEKGGQKSCNTVALNRKNSDFL